MNTLKDSPDELFQAYFAPYPNMFEATTRSNEPVDSKRSEAFQAYEQRDYKKAATLFKDLLKEKNEPGILLLLGNSNMMLGNIKEAEDNFITLNKDYDELDIQAKWFLSLCYLKTGETEKARNILNELGNTEISYATKARELLEKVK
jgi:thioredoxin-like negative regulator of GroEL